MAWSLHRMRARVVALFSAPLLAKLLQYYERASQGCSWTERSIGHSLLTVRIHQQLRFQQQKTSAKMTAILVSFSRRSFTLWWLSLLLLHGVAAAFFSLCALFYSQLEGTRLDAALQYHGIGMKTEWYSTITLSLGFVALPHALLMVKMMSALLFSRTLMFTFGANHNTQKKAKQSSAKKRRNSDRSASS